MEIAADLPLGCGLEGLGVRATHKLTRTTEGAEVALTGSATSLTRWPNVSFVSSELRLLLNSLLSSPPFGAAVRGAAAFELLGSAVGFNAVPGPLVVVGALPIAVVPAGWYETRVPTCIVFVT
jgi:hypothetical protein